MKKTFFVLLISFFCFGPAIANDDGKIIESSPFVFPGYEQLPAWMKDKYDKQKYTVEFLSKKTTCIKIKYLSDGLKITGFIFKPAGTKTKFPVIIYNRGGVGPDAKISTTNFQPMYEMYKLASAGYVVIASQYRGIDGGEGTDELCGADLHDVLNLYPLLKSLSYADSAKIYMMGASRGGTMTLQAIKEGMKIKAAAVGSAVTDWQMLLSRDDAIGKNFWPDYETKKELHISNRSAIQWVDKINTPLLIIHGRNDQVVNPVQAWTFAQKLQEAGKVYEFVLYADEDHPLDHHLDENIRLIADWFKKFP